LDIENYFPSFNFGRVRGFFLKNKAFELQEKVATVIAQIACYDNSLPQGSPCSPIISDLIAHLLDVRLAQLAKLHRCTYSRYADDLTFSTNQSAFPTVLAYQVGGPGSDWALGTDLISEIAKAGFSINNDKTRMQCETSRQLVTGLTVNKKVNIRSDYFRAARAMCNSLFTAGNYYWPGDAAAAQILKFNRLEGVLNHIHHVKNAADRRTDKENKEKPLGSAKLYSALLFYKYFVGLERPLILCEGITDSLYLKAALRKLPGFQPKLIETKDKITKTKISFFKYTALADKILRLGGGAGGIKTFLSHYPSAVKRYKHAPFRHPVIILIDNDDGAKDIFPLVKSKFKAEISLNSTSAFYHLGHNLYLIKTPELGASGSSCIESFFDKSVLETKIGDKIFNAAKKIDPDKEYGKIVFAEKIAVLGKDKIDFLKFSAIFDRVVAVIDHYKAPAIPLLNPV
jgi:hypothetical protein